MTKGLRTTSSPGRYVLMEAASPAIMREVEVEASGFRWQGTHYPSLSAAATAIAGTRWNGPRFFGLRETKP